MNWLPDAGRRLGQLGFPGSEAFRLGRRDNLCLSRRGSRHSFTEAEVDELWAEAEVELARWEDEIRQRMAKVTQAWANKDPRKD